MSDEDGPPPLEDDEDGPPPLEDDEDGPPPPQTDSTLLGLEEKLDPYEGKQPGHAGAGNSGGSAAHDALIRKLQPMPRPKKATKSDVAVASLSPGDTVTVHSLVGAAQHNGKVGIVESYDEAKGRYRVALQGGGGSSGKPLAVKPANLALSKPMSKGFFDSAKPVKKKKKKKKNLREPEPEPEEEGIVEVVTPQFQEQDEQASLRFDEVQKAMAAANERQSEWMNDDFMGRFSKNPRLMKGFSDPRCQKAMQEMQSDPKAATAKYANDKEITEFLREFMGLMGDHFGNLADADDERKKKEVAEATGPMSDPDVQKIMSDPEFMPILQQCQRPGFFTRHMQDPRYAPRLQFLLDKGVFNLNT